MSDDQKPMTAAERVRARMKQASQGGGRTRRRAVSAEHHATPEDVVPRQEPSREVKWPGAPAAQAPNMAEPKVEKTPAAKVPVAQSEVAAPQRRAQPVSAPKLVTPALPRQEVALTGAALESLEVFETKRDRVVRDDAGEYLDVPASWDLLPPGDAAVTRRVKAAGPSWTVREKRGRKMFSRGIWADAGTISRELEAREAEVASPSYQKKLGQSRKRAEKKQEVYVEDFTASVRDFLGFSNQYKEMEATLAQVVSEHATPVGSGTVARTERIPIERRAEAAVIAWMRHQTTAYDTMSIARVKGKRREVRRMLAERSRKLLNRYRAGKEVSGDEPCPLKQALDAMILR